jgi:hypothetical protein
MTTQLVPIHVRYVEAEGGPAGESLWAEPVDANDAGGTFTLPHDLTFTPLRRGDVVACDLDADSILQVTSVRSLVPGILIGFTHPVTSELLVHKVLDAQIAAGHQVHWPADGYAEIFISAPQGTAFESLEPLDIPTSWRPVTFMDTQEREEQISKEVDFELRATPTMNHEPIDYWVPDDPEWARLGIDDPALLGAIQSIAAADPRVLATIQANRHRDVLTYLHRLMVMDPRTLPKLERPLLVEPGA